MNVFKFKYVVIFLNNSFISIFTSFKKINADGDVKLFVQLSEKFQLTVVGGLARRPVICPRQPTCLFYSDWKVLTSIAVEEKVFEFQSYVIPLEWGWNTLTVDTRDDVDDAADNDVFYFLNRAGHKVVFLVDLQAGTIYFRRRKNKRSDDGQTIKKVICGC